MSFPGFPSPPGPGSPPSPNTHDLLSATHADTNAASGVQGDIVVAGATGIWQRFPVGNELDHLVIVGGTPTWSPQAGSGLGNVTGPSTSTDNAIVRWNGPSGIMVQDSLVIIDDMGGLTAWGNVIASGGLTIGMNSLMSGDLTVLGDTNLEGLTNIGGNLSVAGSSSVVNNSDVGGDIFGSGDLTILGDSNLENLTVNQDLTVNGNTIISGDITVLGNVVNSGTVINSVTSGTGPTLIITNSFFNAITSGTTNVILPPAPSAGETFVVKDIDGIAATSPITVEGSGDTIDGSASKEIASNYGSMTLIYGPIEWNII